MAMYILTRLNEAYCNLSVKYQLRWVFINSLIMAIFCVYCIHMLHIVSAQNQSILDPPSRNKRNLIEDAIQALQNGNTSKAIENLRVVDQMISESQQNYSQLQASKLLIGDAIQAVNNNDTSIVYSSKFDRTTIDRANLGQPDLSKYENLQVRDCLHITILF